MPKTLYMFRGLPACGKSTRAKQMLAEFGSGNAKIINKDSLRLMLDNSHWSKDNEKFVLRIRDLIVKEALAEGKHAIVDDTNLGQKHEPRLRDLARESGGTAFEIIDMTDVPLETCLERNRGRINQVPDSVILDMYRQFLAPKVEPPPFNATLPNTLIVDIDGTVAQMNGRGPFEWSKVGQDLPRLPVIAVILSHRGVVELIFVSGRDEVCRPQTEAWIKTNLGLNSPRLYMRPAGDMRKDAVVKTEIYRTHIEGKYNVCAIFEDRPQMIRCWQSLGYGDRLFNVGDGTEF